MPELALWVLLAGRHIELSSASSPVGVPVNKPCRANIRSNRWCCYVSSLSRRILARCASNLSVTSLRGTIAAFLRAAMVQLTQMGLLLSLLYVLLVVNTLWCQRE